MTKSTDPLSTPTVTDSLAWHNASIEEQLRIHDAYWGTSDDVTT